MARIQPIDRQNAPEEIRRAFEEHLARYGGRITNMKATLGHSRLAFEVYMQWYPLYREITRFLGERLAYLFAHAVSAGSNCPLCTTFFRKIIIENGELPEELHLSPREKQLLDFGSALARQQGIIPDEVYFPVARDLSQHELVVLVAFAGQMVATNVFNNALEVDIDEYLSPYVSLTQPAPGHDR